MSTVSQEPITTGQEAIASSQEAITLNQYHLNGGEISVSY